MASVPPLDHAITAAASGLAAQCTVPFVCEESADVVYVFGTGTLFHLGGMHVVVTAAHVAQHINSHALGLPIDDRRAPIWRPQGGQIHTVDDPKFDIAVLRLDDPDLIAALERTRRFLTLDNVLLRDSPGLVDFYVHGFPSGSARYRSSELTGVPFRFATSRYQGPTNVVGTVVDREVHLLLAHADRALDSLGEPLELPPSLGGISGCSIWTTLDRGGSDKLWTPDENVKVVAVQTHVARNRWIRATKWVVVANALKKIEPSLEPALQAAWRRSP